MIRHRLAMFVLLLFTMAMTLTVWGQRRPDPATVLKAQRDAMASFALMDGLWRGPAWTLLSSGEKHTLTQTERVGSFLDGTIKVLEGRGYEADGTVAFNAFGIVSYDPATHAYTLHSYALGHVGDFALTTTADGWVWEIPAGPMTIRYTAAFKDGTWREVGDRIMPGKDPVRIFEMTLKRIGDTDWPAAGAVSLK